eukprot:g12315.t1
MFVNFTRQLSQCNRVCLQAAASNGSKLAASRNVTRRIVKKRFASTSSVSSSCCLQRRQFTAGIHKLDFRIPIVFKPRRIRFRRNSTLKSTRGAAPASGGKVFPKLLGFAAFAGGGYYLVNSNDIIADFFWGLFGETEDDGSLFIENIKEPAAEFVHPYLDASWLFKLQFFIRRGFYLIYMWAPATFMSLVGIITGIEFIQDLALEWTVRTLENCGMTFQKFGQWLSMRPDIFSPKVIEALSTLCDDSKVHEFEVTRKVIREAFGDELEEYFEEFNQEPLASGSVAQVYRAKLKDKYALKSGEVEVAVKIRHPQVIEESYMDIDIVYFAMKYMPFLTIPFNKDSFLATIQKQMSFKWEAFNMERFAKNFRNETKDGRLRFPQVSSTLLGESVLIMSFAKGKPVSDMFSVVDGGGHGWKVVDLLKSGKNSGLESKKELANRVFDINMKMFLRDNFVHGDMHGGNLLYSQDKEGNNVLTVLDAGLTVSLDSQVARSFSQFLYSMIMGDVDGIMTKLIEFNDSKKKVDISGFRQDVEKQVNLWVGERSTLPLTAPKAPDGGPISIGDLMGGIMFSMQRYGIALRGDVAATLLTISISEGLIRQLDPSFDMCRGAMRYFIKYNDSAYSVIPTGDEVVETVKDTVSEVADEVIPEVPSIDEVKGALPEIEIPEVKIPENVEKGVEEVKDKINELIK